MPGFNPNAPLFLPSTSSSSTIELRVSGDNLTPDSLVQRVNLAIATHLANLNPSLTILLQIRPDPQSSDLIAVFLASSYIVASRAVALFNSLPSPLPWSVEALLINHNIEPLMPFYFPYPYPFFYPPPDPSIKPVPSFITNLVAGNKSDVSLITITDDEGAEIQVNPCRLFVGNIPFLSTWPSLKNFLVASVFAAEPHASLDIFRVEIPMQTSSSTDEMLLRGSSRGFAIVTTGNQETSELLIKLTNDTVFEGRSLTVRYDRFPDYNNYVVQNLFRNKHHRTPNMLGNLGYERNTIHHRLYYGSHTSPYSMQPPSQSQSHSSSQLSTQPSTVDSLLDTPTPPKLKPKPSLAANSPKKTTRNHHKPSKPRARAPHDDIGEEQRARELVDSFRSLGLH